MASRETLIRENQLIRSTTSNKFKIIGSVPTVFYIPEYITTVEEDQLLNHIYEAPVSKWKLLKNRRLQNWGGVVHEKGLLAQDLPPWLKQITHKICEESRLFPSVINHVLINEYLPDQGIMPHQDGPAYEPVVAILSLRSPVVMDFSPHLCFQNATPGNYNEGVTKELEETEMSSGNQLTENRPFSVVLKPRSLLIFKDKAYSEYLHGIKDCKEQQYDKAVNVTNGLKIDEQVQPLSFLKTAADDREARSDTTIYRTMTRVSLTCRAVKKVHKNLIKL